jgi:hypothetical protein
LADDWNLLASQPAVTPSYHNQQMVEPPSHPPALETIFKKLLNGNFCYFGLFYKYRSCYSHLPEKKESCIFFDSCFNWYSRKTSTSVASF